MEEIWKIVNKFDERYEISNYGRFRNRKTGRILKQFNNKHGYYFIPLSFKGKVFNVYIHVYVAKLFVPNDENKPLVNHKDGDKHNNRCDNLEWVTYSENLRHAYKNNLRTSYLDKVIKRGTEHYMATITEEEVLKIRELYKQGLGCRKIAKILGISRNVAYGVTSGKTWKHVK